MKANQCENTALKEAFVNEYTDLITVLARECYDRVDKSYMLRIYYHQFFEKSSISPSKISVARAHLLQFFNEHFYAEYRIKDVETIGALNKRKNYVCLFQKWGVHESLDKVRLELNRILLQQEILKSITYLSHCYEEVNAFCWKEID